MNTAIITAAGLSTRAKLNKNKNLALFGNEVVIVKTVKAFLAVDEIDEIIVTSSENDFEEFEKLLLPLSSKISIVLGGETRQLSVKNALNQTNRGFVLIHDGARPFVTPDLIKKCLYKAIKDRSCVPVTGSIDTLARVENGEITGTLREGLYRVQTPQAFKTSLIKKAHSLATEFSATDDSGLFAKYIEPCKIIEGDENNVKLTNKEDFESNGKFKVGTGFDIHQLVEGRKLILGGVEIPHFKGLLGHSDADVVCHALMDALLSSCSQKDIGYHFPDTDDKYKGVSSTFLLKTVLEIIKKAGYKPVNATISILAEKPKLAPYVEAITKNLAAALSLSEENVGVTCTTLEGLGIIGEEKAIGAQAYCLVEKI